ncbi:MAG: glycosyltransferase family 2 protein [bacterium]
MAGISIVIVNFNGGELVLKCVQHALGSTAEIQLIIVDNASSDGSHQQLQSQYGDNSSVEFISNSQNLGFAVAVNQGLARAKAPFLLLLNPDCLLDADTLSRMLGVLASYPDAGMAGCRILNPDGTEQAGCRRNLPDAGAGIARALGIRRAAGRNIDLNVESVPDKPVFVEAISGAFMFVRREALEAVGLLDEAYFMHCEDLDWCRRFLDAGWNILFVPDVEVLHYQGSCSAATPLRVEWHKHRGMVRYYQKFIASEHNPLFNLLVYAGINSRYLMIALRQLLQGKRGSGVRG